MTSWGMWQPFIAGLSLVRYKHGSGMQLWNMLEHKKKAGRGNDENLDQDRDVECMTNTHTCTQKHKYTVVQCSSSFQHNIIWQQRSFRGGWSHTGFTAMRNKIKKPIFLQFQPKKEKIKTDFCVCEERKRQSDHNQSNDLIPGQQRHAWSISSNLPLLFFCAQCGTHNFMCAFIQRNSMSACFQQGWLQ